MIDPMFGKFIAERRIAAGLSQKQLGKASGISQPTISAIERGVQLIGNRNKRRFPKLAAALGVELGELERVYREAIGNTESARAAARPYEVFRELQGVTITSEDLEALLKISRELSVPMTPELFLRLLRHRKTP